MKDASRDSQQLGRVVGTLDDIALGFLLDDVRRYTDSMYLALGQASAMRRRQGEEMDAQEAYLFFRSKERADTLKVLLQYLVAFNRAPPPCGGPDDEHSSRVFRQFREFCGAYLDLLREADVQAAACRGSTLPAATAGEAATPVESLVHELSGLLAAAQRAVREDYLKLFRALQRHCLFWFEVRGFRFERVRRSDFFVYTLARLLQETTCA